MAEPGSGTTPPGGRCIPCTTGTIRVTVYLQTVCWDTDPALGLDTPDRLFTGVTVRVHRGPAVLEEKLTDGAGQAIFEALDAPGSYSVYVEKTGFDDISEDTGK